MSEKVEKLPLLEWGETVARPAAERALAHGAPLIPGEEQCRFCKAKGDCPALAEKSLSIAVDGFENLDSLNDEPELINVQLLTDTQLAHALRYKPMLATWLAELDEVAMQRFKDGRSVAGFKVVEGRANRRWSSEDDVLKAARRMRGVKLADVTEQKLLSPAKLEKVVGKDHRLITQFVVKPPGKPTVVPVSDKRPALDINPASGFEALDQPHLENPDESR